jgi:hypothetical protein
VGEVAVPHGDGRRGQGGKHRVGLEVFPEPEPPAGGGQPGVGVALVGARAEQGEEGDPHDGDGRAEHLEGVVVGRLNGRHRGGAGEPGRDQRGGREGGGQRLPEPVP